MKLAKIKAVAKKIVLNFDGEVLNVTVYPNRWTSNYVDKITNDEDGDRSILAEMLSPVIAGWDLEFDPEVDFDDAGSPLSGVVPTDAETLAKYVPTSVLMAIMSGIQDAMRPNPTPSKPSGSFS